MKSFIATLLLCSLGTSAFAETPSIPLTEMPAAVETDILSTLTDMKKAEFGAISARVILSASFAEPDETAYLLLYKNAGFDGSQTNTALFSLKEAWGQGAFVKDVITEKGDILVVEYMKNNVTHSLRLKINGLTATILP